MFRLAIGFQTATKIRNKKDRKESNLRQNTRKILVINSWKNRYYSDEKVFNFSFEIALVYRPFFCKNVIIL